MRNNDPPRWLLDLVKRWRNDKTAVVTLNYDTFVEATLEAVISGRDENRGGLDTGTISINPELIPLDPDGVDTGGRSTRKDWVVPGQDEVRMSLYKLHGSTRWFWDDLTRCLQTP